MNILFVCTGNTCRSPMAEAMLRHMTPNHEIKSAGIAAVGGSPASKHTQQILNQRNISLDHAAKQLDAELVQWADLILTMTFIHKMSILTYFEESKGKVFTLKEFVTEETELETDKQLMWDIVDPFGGDLQEYSICAEDIELALQKLLKKIEKS